jgi:hypothetical protein
LVVAEAAHILEVADLAAVRVLVVVHGISAAGLAAVRILVVAHGSAEVPGILAVAAAVSVVAAGRVFTLAGRVSQRLRRVRP